MELRRLIIFIFLLTAFFQSVYGLPSDITEQLYIRIESAGQPGGQIMQGKVVKLFTAGGIINIYPTSHFNTQSTKLYSRIYFKDNGPSHKTTLIDNSKWGLKRDGSQIYLLPDQEAIVDVLYRQKNTLVARYIINRPRLIPEIKVQSRNNNSNLPFRASPSIDHKGEFSVSPGEPIRINIAPQADFKNLEVEYTLINLKTKRSSYQSVKTGIVPLKLSANTEYELRFNYVLQPESVGVGYIHVKHYWYQSTITYILLSIALITLGFLVITVSLKNKISSSRTEQQKLEAAAIRLQSLLNPHFTFNALSSIQGLINTDRIEEANYYLQEFSYLLRQTLAKSQQLFNSLDQEFEMMRMYLRLEALRFNFCWDMELAEGLDLQTIEIPTLLLQPLIENSIKHGLSGLGSKGQLQIICKQGPNKDTFVIIVKDNGLWLDKSTTKGYGLSLTKERIRTINQMRKDQTITLDFDKQLGTAAILTFHNWMNN